MAMAILTSRPNSHPFEERRVLLTESAKIGRSVAKSRPAPNNCIFECKVLSRNHAILWYENEKFFLRDTKSSNGTFVNNVRLSKGSEESEPKEINSGDIVQFGVDVVENSKKVTHGCIIANITLYLPNGNEATRSSSRGLFKARENGLPAQELWQLSQYLQDALYREQMLENRLTALQRLIHSSQNILDDNCQKFAQEDKLLSRLEMLENQIEALTRNLSEDDIKRRLLTLQEDRHNYEMRSKESLKRMLQEKLEAVQKLSEVERSCSTAEDECLHYKSLYEKSQQEMKELTERHAQRLEEMRSLQEQVEEAEKRHAAVDEQANEERREFESNLEEARKKEAEFAARAEAMQAECDFAKEQLIAMKAQLDKRREGVLKSSENKTDKRSQDSDVVNDKPIECEENLGSQLGQEPQLFEETAVFSNEVPEQSSSDDLKILQAKLKKLENEVVLKEKHLENFKGQLTETQALLKDSKEEVEALNEKLSKSREEAAEDKLKISKLEEEVMEYHLQAVDQLTFTDGLEQEDQDEYSSNMNQDKTLSQSRLQSLLDKILKVNSLVKERRKRLLEWTESEETTLSGVNEVLMVNSDLQDKRESDPLKLGLEGMQNIEDNFSEIEKLVEAEHEEGKQLKGQLSSTKNDLKVKEQLVGELQEELKNAQAYTKDFKQQILDLRDKLLEEQELTRKKDEYLASLRREINELSRERDLMQVEKNCEHQAVETAKNAAREMQKKAAKSAETAGKNKVELSAITEDNLSLKQKIQTLESELKKYRRENNRLSADYTKLQGSYRDLELQSRAEHEKQLKQQYTLRNKMEREVQEKESIKQASSVGEKLQSTEETMKVQEAEWRKNIEQEKEKVSKMQSYLLSLMAVIFAMILAYTLDFISVSRGGRLGGS